MIKRLEKVIHISDIHLRNFKRHEEYRRVFNKLYKWIGETHTPETLILLTGDIVHSKTDVTPELYQEVQLFLKTLCRFGEVLMIPGNHDCNLGNSDRLDALTPIVNALGEKNLTYLKDTDMVTIGGVDFYHWSVFDKKSKYPKKNPNRNNTSICLFHGLVNESVNDSGYSMMTDYMKASDFEGFDMVMLGDIHTPQYLNKENTIAYPGSLIQQNYGESLTHGLLVWNVLTKKSEFVEIYNDTAFTTVDIDGGIPTQLGNDLPENIYLRVRHRNSSQEEIKRVIREIKEVKNVLEVTITKVSDTDSRSRQHLYSSLIDFRNVESQNEYITNFLSSSYSANIEDIKSVCEINKTINKKLSTNEIPRNTIWTPKRFRFDNMFGYRKDNYVDFSNMEGTYGIFAPNASGKSTLLDALTYCLFDKCSKTSRAQEVMNNQSKDFYCEFEFELNGKNYFIERIGTTHKHGNVRVDVDFYYLDDVGNKVSLNGKDRSDTNSNIRKLLGSYEDFVLTSFSTQTGNSSFIDIGQRERKDLLCQFMDLNVFDELYNIANEESKETQYILKDLEKKDWESEKSQIQKNLVSTEEGISKIVEYRDSIKEKLDDIDETINNLNKQLRPIDQSLVGFDMGKVEKTISSLNNNIEKVNGDIAKNIALFESENKTLSEYKSQLLKYDLENIQSKLQELSLCNSQLQKTELKLKKQVTIHEGNQQKMEKLKDLRYDENCKFCMDNVFVKDAIETKGKIKQEELEIENTNQAIETLKTKITSLKEYEEFKKSYDELDKLINSKSISTLKIENTIKDLESSKEKSLKEIDELKKLVDKYLEQELLIKENDTIQSQISEAKSSQKEYKSEWNKSSEEYTNQQVAKSVLENSIKECETSISKISEYQTKSKLYKYYLESIHRDGIPHSLITKTLPQIQDEVNSILSQLVEFKVILSTDNKNINGYIAYSKDRYWGIELVSGMEKFITSLAIRCALISVSSLPRPNFIFIDEGFGALDKDNLGAVVSLFEYLKSQFQFTAVISHIESMRDMVDEIIEITKKDGVSKIQYS